MVIAAAKILQEEGVNYQKVMDVVAQDLDWKGVYMCYVQLSLLGYAAVVQQVDALALKPFDVARYTPGWFLHGFPMRGIRA